MPSITVSTVQLDSLTVRVRTSTAEHRPARAEHPPYVLVHGLGMTHRYFDRLADELSSDAVVHSIDLPGYGSDPRPRRQLDVEDHGALIVGALEALGIGRCTLVGHSMGAQFVTAAALRAPELAERVVLVGPVVDRLRRTVLQQSVSLLLDTFRESPRANLIVYTDYFRTGMRWYLRQLMPMMEYPLERAVERLACPVLVLRGGRDPVARRRWCRELADRAVDGAFVEVPGQAHVVQLQAAAHVAAVIAASRRRPRVTADGFLLQASDGTPGNLEHRLA
jgi:pimeloyl-ACP methyl ester carboxylesterase